MEWMVYKSNHKKPETEIDYNKLSSKNKVVLEKWLNEKSIKSKGKKRADCRRRAIIKLLTFVKKDYDKISYDDYVSVAQAISNCSMGVYSKNGERNFISRFLKDNFDEWEKRFKVKDRNKGLELLNYEKQDEKNKISPADLLTDQEVEKMLKSTSDMKKAALVAMLDITGARPEEILKLRWSDVDFHKKMIYLYSSKTKKKRPFYIAPAFQHLQRLKNEVDSADDSLVFPAVSGGIITNAGLNYLLQELARKAGIKKKVHAYLFRHKRLSYLITKLSPKVYEEVAGHSLSMGMKTYAHLTEDSIIKEMRENVFEAQELGIDEKNEIQKEIEQLKTKLDRHDIIAKVILQNLPESVKKKIVAIHYPTKK